MQKRDFSERFHNWLHWCQIKGIYHGKAGSAEGRYRSPQTWEPQNPKPAWLVTMDINDAVLVNRAYSQLAERTRKIIKVIWIKAHWRPQWQAQAIGCHWKELEEVGYRAYRMLENRLEFIERKCLHTPEPSVNSTVIVGDNSEIRRPACNTPMGACLSSEPA